MLLLLADISKAEALRSVAEDAYEEASAGLGFAPVRMVGYAARRLAQARYGIPADSFTIDHRGDWGYALRTLEKTNPALVERMTITRKARGVGYEPHTRYEIRFGTQEVERYVRSWRDPEFDLAVPEAYQGVSTSGPAGLFQGVLIVEKDGLLEFVRRARIGERHDLMVAASEGQGAMALRELIERFAIEGLPIYLLRDYDIAGIQIAAALSGRDTKSWEWTVQPNVIDLGVHYADIAAWEIEDESVSGEDDWRPLLRELGSSEEELAYLVGEPWIAPSTRKQKQRRGKPVTHWEGRRAELNGLIGQKFIDYTEAKLAEQQITKLIPQDEWLQQAYIRAVRVKRLNDALAAVEEAGSDGIVVPADLRSRVEAKLTAYPRSAWDIAVALLAEEDIEEEESS